MSSSTRIKSARFDAAKYGGLDRDALIRIFRMMQMSRRLDDREIQLKRQNKIYFQISGAGHEAISAAAAMVLKPRHDWIYPYYRDRALVLGLGVSPSDMLLQGVGAKADPRFGRAADAVPHWSAPKLEHRNAVVTPTGTQWLQAIGSAEAFIVLRKISAAHWKRRKQGSNGEFANDARGRGDRTFPEGTARPEAKGNSSRALNAASLLEAAGGLRGAGQRLRDIGSGEGANAGSGTFPSWCGIGHP